MNVNQANILLIEDNPVETKLMQAMLSKPGAGGKNYIFDLRCAATLAAGIELLGAGGFDLVLLDLSLPDARGLETLIKLREHNSNVPVVVLTGMEDEELADEMLRRGAQDYLLKGQITLPLLSRAIRYAIERHRLLRSMSLVDELTGLYNRRGFFALAEQQIKLAARQRSERGLLLVYADLDGLKQINDCYGHEAGSRAIAQAGELLTRSFRDTDIIARIGGDEFVVLAIEAYQEGGALLIARLRRNLREFNEQCREPYDLSLSVGVATVPSGELCPLEKLLAEADAAMYADKSGKKLRAAQHSSTLALNSQLV